MVDSGYDPFARTLGLKSEFSFRVCEFLGRSYLLAQVWDVKDCEEATLIHRSSRSSSSWLSYCDRDGRDSLRYDRLCF